MAPPRNAKRAFGGPVVSFVRAAYNSGAPWGFAVVARTDDYAVLELAYTHPDACGL